MYLAATAEQLSLDLFLKLSLCFHPFSAHPNFSSLVNVCLLSFSTRHVVISLFSSVFFCYEYYSKEREKLQEAPIPNGKRLPNTKYKGQAAQSL